MTTPYSVASVRNRPFPIPAVNPISSSPQDSTLPPSNIHSPISHPVGRALPRKSPPRIRAPNLSPSDPVSSNLESLREVHQSQSKVFATQGSFSPAEPIESKMANRVMSPPQIRLFSKNSETPHPLGLSAEPFRAPATAGRGGPNPIRRVMTPPKIMTTTQSCDLYFGAISQRERR